MTVVAVTVAAAACTIKLMTVGIWVAATRATRIVRGVVRRSWLIAAAAAVFVIGVVVSKVRAVCDVGGRGRGGGRDGRG